LPFSRPSPSASTAAGGAKPFPPIKVQGIFFRIKDPSVLINGKTLLVGDDLDGVVVKKIERSSVTLEFSGQTKIYKL